MLERYKNSLSSQIKLLCAFTLTSLALSTALNYKPRLGFSAENVLTGLFAGVLIGGIATALSTSLLFANTKFRKQEETKYALQKKLGKKIHFGAILCDAAGEELFIRGVVFGILLQTSTALAFSACLLLTIVACFKRGEFIQIILQTLLGLSYAIVFYYSKSLLAIFLARLCCELVQSSLLSLILCGSKKLAKIGKFFQSMVPKRFHSGRGFSLRKLVPLTNLISQDPSAKGKNL